MTRGTILAFSVCVMICPAARPDGAACKGIKAALHPKVRSENAAEILRKALPAAYVPADEKDTAGSAPASMGKEDRWPFGRSLEGEAGAALIDSGGHGSQAYGTGSLYGRAHFEVDRSSGPEDPAAWSAALSFVRKHLEERKVELLTERTNILVNKLELLFQSQRKKFRKVVTETEDLRQQAVDHHKETQDAIDAMASFGRSFARCFSDATKEDCNGSRGGKDKAPGHSSVAPPTTQAAPPSPATPSPPATIPASTVSAEEDESLIFKTDSRQWKSTEDELNDVECSLRFTDAASGAEAPASAEKAANRYALDVLLGATIEPLRGACSASSPCDSSVSARPMMQLRVEGTKTMPELALGAALETALVTGNLGGLSDGDRIRTAASLFIRSNDDGLLRPLGATLAATVLRSPYLRYEEALASPYRWKALFELHHAAFGGSTLRPVFQVWLDRPFDQGRARDGATLLLQFRSR